MKLTAVVSQRLDRDSIAKKPVVRAESALFRSMVVTIHTEAHCLYVEGTWHGVVGNSCT